ncbi:aldo/keto reductase [Goodfellowiella coeruleoviolacea]|uniref:Oxidoreductase n=1 Tax=Goodfellowiella coeruleoviolacea TaxID=334858 RepID=A0AAE3GFD7_9PSEU|nr:aldo/keto reductase [Goodfellowiella coeruleoviolacea]MCP2166362.1 putative oxidoreductase [Goodfellowiella coeruleoviolacea]
MERRTFGTTDMAITPVGFGAWAVGGPGVYGWGPQDDDDSVAAIRRAVELGVNWVDTAPVYGRGHSEDVVARALADLPEADRPYVFTKCGMVFTSDDPGATPELVGRPESIRRECEQSLRRLGVDRLDLLQMHWPPTDGTAVEDYWGALLELKREGKIRAAGLSNHSADQLERAEAVGHVDSLQPHFSAIARDFAGADLEWCRRHDTAVIGYSPMESGLLTGKYDQDSVAKLDPGDWRRQNPEFTTKLRDNLAVVRALDEVARRHQVSVPAAAVAWTLAWPGITGAIVGARRADQVDDWVGAASVTLATEDLAAVAVAIEANQVGSGPTQP